MSSKYWLVNGLKHRVDGPAVEWWNGTKEWWLNGVRHREDGPAVEFGNGVKEWWINDVQFTEEEFNQWLAKKQLNEKLHSTLEERQSTKKTKI